MPINPLDSSHIIKDFPDHALLDIARNDSAQKEYRLFAVEILRTRKSPKLQHPDLRELVEELEIELEGIVFEHPAPSGPGPMTAGVTTQTLYGANDEVIDNTGPISPEAPVDVPPTEPAPIPPKPASKEPDAAQ